MSGFLVFNSVLGVLEWGVSTLRSQHPDGGDNRPSPPWMPGRRGFSSVITAAIP
jgi:hypothetical protein